MASFPLQVFSISLFDLFCFQYQLCAHRDRKQWPSGGRISIFRAADEYNTLYFCFNFLSISFPNIFKEKVYFQPAQEFWMIGVKEPLPTLEFKGVGKKKSM